VDVAITAGCAGRGRRGGKLLRTDKEGLGKRFREEVESKCRAVVENPLAWNERRGGYRRANLGGFPHYIAFLIDEDEIVVMAVGHSSRRPDYWKGRVI